MAIYGFSVVVSLPTNGNTNLQDAIAGLAILPLVMGDLSHIKQATAETVNENKEKQLVVLLQETGAPNVADLLFKPYIPRVRKFLLSRGACQSDVDDLVQETLLTGFLKINQFREESTFSTWLMRIAFRKFIDTKRKSQSITEAARKVFAEPVR